MRQLGAAAVLVLASAAMPLLAAELPTRKAGLWEVRMNGANATVRQCIDAATDQMMMSVAGPLAQNACAKPSLQQSGNTLTVDSTCTFKDKNATSHAVITGSFDSAYEMTVTVEGDAMPGGKMTMAISGTWLGPCAADQKPGDMIIGNSVKVNILDMQKNGLLQGMPPPR